MHKIQWFPEMCLPMQLQAFGALRCWFQTHWISILTLPCRVIYQDFWKSGFISNFIEFTPVDLRRIEFQFWFFRAESFIMSFKKPLYSQCFKIHAQQTFGLNRWKVSSRQKLFIYSFTWHGFFEPLTRLIEYHRTKQNRNLSLPNTLSLMRRQERDFYVHLWTMNGGPARHLDQNPLLPNTLLLDASQTTWFLRACERMVGPQDTSINQFWTLIHFAITPSFLSLAKCERAREKTNFLRPLESHHSLTCGTVHKNLSLNPTQEPTDYHKFDFGLANNEWLTLGNRNPLAISWPE